MLLGGLMSAVKSNIIKGFHTLACALAVRAYSGNHMPCSLASMNRSTQLCRLGGITIPRLNLLVYWAISPAEKSTKIPYRSLNAWLTSAHHPCSSTYAYRL